MNNSKLGVERKRIAATVEGERRRRRPIKLDRIFERRTGNDKKKVGFPNKNDDLVNRFSTSSHWNSRNFDCRGGKRWSLKNNKIEWLKAKSSVGACDVAQELFGIFANEGFLVITRDIVPRDTIVINVVQNRQTSFGRSVDVELCIVRLTNFLVSSLRPGIVAPTARGLVRRRYLLTVCRPEPTEDRLWLEVTTVLATLEITQTTGRPDVRYIVWKLSIHPNFSFFFCIIHSFILDFINFLFFRKTCMPLWQKIIVRL